ILLARERAALPVHHDAGAKARRSYFLSHGVSQPLSMNAAVNKQPNPGVPGRGLRVKNVGTPTVTRSSLRREGGGWRSRLWYVYSGAAGVSSRSERGMRVWGERRLIGEAVPRARGMMRFSIGPPATRESITTSSSTLRAPRSSALPCALLMTCSMSRALLFG